MHAETIHFDNMVAERPAIAHEVQQFMRFALACPPGLTFSLQPGHLLTEHVVLLFTLHCLPHPTRGFTTIDDDHRLVAVLHACASLFEPEVPISQVPTIDMTWPEDRAVEVMKAACLRTGFFYGESSMLKSCATRRLHHALTPEMPSVTMTLVCLTRPLFRLQLQPLYQLL